MPDAGSRKRFAVIRDIVTRVHVVTVRIRDGVTRYALCTHVTPRGAAVQTRFRRQSHDAALSSVDDDSRSHCEKRVIDVRAVCVFALVRRYAEKKAR